MAEKFPQGAAPQENKMGVLPIGRLLTNMAVPMMISMLVQACYKWWTACSWHRSARMP